MPRLSEIIPFLDVGYADAVISAIHEAGGDVLKLIGDGILAIFTAPDRGEACRAALQPPLFGRGKASLDSNQRRATETGSPPPTCISVCISARSSSAISAAKSGSILPSSVRP